VIGRMLEATQLRLGSLTCCHRSCHNNYAAGIFTELAGLFFRLPITPPNRDSALYTNLMA
jgi:hypothetical protein